MLPSWLRASICSCVSLKTQGRLETGVHTYWEESGQRRPQDAQASNGREGERLAMKASIVDAAVAGWHIAWSSSSLAARSRHADHSSGVASSRGGYEVEEQRDWPEREWYKLSIASGLCCAELA